MRMRLLGVTMVLGCLPVGAQQTGTPVSTFQATARSVVVDVVVSDKGRPVTGLAKEKFSIFENGKPQAVNFFEAHTSVAPETVRKRTAQPPGIYSNIPLSEYTGSVNVLLLDALNTPLADQSYLRREMMKYLKTMPPGTRIAIFTLASQLQLIHGFTADAEELRAALKTSEANPQGSALLPTMGQRDALDSIQTMVKIGDKAGSVKGGVQPTSPGSSTAISNCVNAGGYPWQCAGLMRLVQFEKDYASFEMDQRVKMTLQAMQQISRYLGGIPGRKNVVWFSGSFPSGILPDESTPDAFEAVREYTEDIRRTSNMLAAAQVAIYPVDARGLMTAPMYDMSNTGAHYNVNGVFGSDNQEFFKQTSLEHGTMDALAKETGGESIYNSNGIADALSRVVSDGSNYYTLAYTPAKKGDPRKARKITIKIDGGYKLAYRRSYFPDAADSRPAAQRARDDFNRSMIRGVPDATQILFKVMVVPSGKAAATPIAGDNGRLRGNSTRYSLDYAATLRGFGLTDAADGSRHGTLLIAAIAYNGDGKELNSLGRSYPLDLSAADYQKYVGSGLQVHEELDLPSGPVYLRVGVFDPASGRFGTLEIPLTVGAPKTPGTAE